MKSLETILVSMDELFDLREPTPEGEIPHYQIVRNPVRCLIETFSMDKDDLRLMCSPQNIIEEEEKMGCLEMEMASSTLPDANESSS